jgi:hypothetical protein
MLSESKYLIKDVDINVTAFPDIKNSNTVLARLTSYNMMKVTYLDATDAVKCDIATKRADIIPLFLKYSICDEENGNCARKVLKYEPQENSEAQEQAINNSGIAFDLSEIGRETDGYYDNNKLPVYAIRNSKQTK